MKKLFRKLMFPYVWKRVINGVDSAKDDLYKYPFLIHLELVVKDDMRTWYILGGNMQDIFKTVVDNYFRDMYRKRYKMEKRNEMLSKMSNDELDIYYSRVNKWKTHLMFNGLDKLELETRPT